MYIYQTVYTHISTHFASYFISTNVYNIYISLPPAGLSLCGPVNAVTCQRLFSFLYKIHIQDYIH